MQLPELDDADATEMAAWVRRKEVSPTELLAATIERIDARNPPLNAVIRRLDARARRQIEDGLPDGPFRGVPFLLKDLGADLHGVPTTAGCRLLASWVPDTDAEIVRRYLAAGLVIVGKTNTPELGIVGVTEPELFGPTRNPWNLSRTPGGSSGGSAAAVAARMVPAAHAGDGGGSIRIPASSCGLVGLKPSRGRSPLRAAWGSGWAGQVVEHAVTRTVRDSAGLLDVIAGPLPGARFSLPAPDEPYVRQIEREPGRLRVAVFEGAILGLDNAPENLRAIEVAKECLASLGHAIEVASPRWDREALTRAYLVPVAASVAREVARAEQAAGRPVTRAELEPGTMLLAELGRRLSAADLVEAMEVAERLEHELARFFERFDLLLTSTTCRPPPPIGTFAPKTVDRVALPVARRVLPTATLWKLLRAEAAKQLEVMPNTEVFNLAGVPAISVPVCFTDDGLPIGAQLVARFGAEGLLLQVAAQLERELAWAERRPPSLAR